MEKENIVTIAELACKAHLAGKALNAISAVATSFDIEFEPEVASDSAFVQSPKGRVSRGCGHGISGVSVGDTAYAMELDDWVEYYQADFGQQGFVCFGANILGSGRDRIYSLSPGLSEEISPAFQAERLVVSPSAPPLRVPSLPEDMYAFAEKHGLWGNLETAVKLLNDCFPGATSGQLKLENDPETEEEWLVIEFEIDEEIDDILNSYDFYTDLWISSVPWPEREKIRLSYIAI
ncbi:MAG: hypothetical protein ABSG91_17745 [Syntrophobacteraceae bacterium]|jgi:hypothetical protein